MPVKYAQRANKPVAELSGSRIDDAVTEGSVKRLVFQPSKRSIWIVVGKDNEHWSDPERGFCTCKDFYFKTLSGGAECYHLSSVRKAIEESRYISLEFDDHEYVQMMQAILDDQLSLLDRR